MVSLNIYKTREELFNANKDRACFVGMYLKDGKKMYCESTAVSMTEVEVEGEEGNYQFKLPKIPRRIYEYVKRFFVLAMNRCGKKAVLSLGYVQNGDGTGNYIIHIPDQMFSGFRVHIDEARIDETIDDMSIYHVMDIYSCGFEPADIEFTERHVRHVIQGAVGRLDLKEPELILCSTTCTGKDMFVETSEIFDDGSTEVESALDEELDDDALEEFFDVWKTVHVL